MCQGKVEVVVVTGKVISIRYRDKEMAKHYETLIGEDAKMKEGDRITPAELLAAQAAIDEHIQTHPVELGYDPAKVEPIYDGVVDAEAYLAAHPKIMWILKEPYDDFDAEGMPAGGGWTMFKDFGEGDTLAKAVNRNAALRNVTYASYAIQNGIASYAELPWITDKPEVYEKAIRSIAYVNIGKMPGDTTTSDAHLACREARLLVVSSSCRLVVLRAAVRGGD